VEPTTTLHRHLPQNQTHEEYVTIIRRKCINLALELYKIHSHPATTSNTSCGNVWGTIKHTLIKTA